MLQRDQLQGPVLRRPRMPPLEPPAPRQASPAGFVLEDLARASGPGRCGVGLCDGGTHVGGPWMPPPTRCWAPTASAAARPARICGASSRSMRRASPWTRWRAGPAGPVPQGQAGRGGEAIGSRSQQAQPYQRVASSRPWTTRPRQPPRPARCPKAVPARPDGAAARGRSRTGWAGWC